MCHETDTEPRARATGQTAGRYRSPLYDEGVTPRILLFAATTGYQVRSFSEAAQKLGMELVLATDRCHHLDNPWGDDAVPMQFEELVAARGPFDGIVAVGDQPALAAARVAENLNLRFHPSQAVAAAKNKLRTREKFRDAGLLTPQFHLNDPPIRYPAIMKPLNLSASRGVIRVNDPGDFETVRDRVRKISGEQAVLVEDFIPGREFAVEGIATNGTLQVLALFDKPDPLDGPFFEETIYITPSREPAPVQRAIVEAAQRAITALGLSDGPIHAEMRVNERGVWMLEVAPRPIGGLCARVLRFESGAPLEEILLRHAIGEDTSRLRLSPGTHGVMMIPIPRAGIYQDVHGLDDSRAIEHIEDVQVTAKKGQVLLPLPEGASYLGFIFARADTYLEVENALRRAHSTLDFQFAATLPVVR